MKKVFTFAVSLSLFASVYAQDVKILSCTGQFPTEYEPQFQALGLSGNGRYVCGAGEGGAVVFVADLQSDEFKWSLIEDEEGGELRHVDDNGVAVGLEYTYSFGSGELSFNQIPAGYRNVLYEDLTNDGSLIVGSLGGPDGSLAAYNDNGTGWKLLPIPSDDELMGLAPRFGGVSSAKRISGDGGVILGFLGSFFMPFLWYRNDAGEYVPDFFLARYLKLTEADMNDDSKPLVGVSAHYLNISNNGRYIAILGMIGDEGQEQYIPVVYDTVTKEAKFYTEKQEIDMAESGLYPSGISDDGTFIGCVGVPFFGSIGSFIMKPGQTQAELFNDVFPQYYELLGESDYLGFSVPTAISADGKKIVGYTFYSEDYNDKSTPALYISYVISLDADNAVEEISPADPGLRSIYSIDGRNLSHLQKGLNIVRNADGSVSKILKK
ncbi:MAG: hypothetical protein K2N25_03640 [Muribaculaceae bacterium]|nr:hypothetical protein [Muribaculaceae bacterium]